MADQFSPAIQASQSKVTTFPMHKFSPEKGVVDIKGLENTAYTTTV